MLWCAVVTVWLVLPVTGFAQEVSFTPRYDGIEESRRKRSGTPTPSPASAQQKVYSFARFNGLFWIMCSGLEAEGRRARVFDVAKAGLAEELECSSCRALYRQFMQACGPTKTAKPRVKPSPSTAKGGEGDGGGEDIVEDIVSATPTTTPPARYPRTDVVDAASRLSAGLYELEPGAGSTFAAVKNFESRLLRQKDLTPGERDYFGVLATYLLAGWDGRPDSPLAPKKLSKEDIADLFQ
jgi:hypothetical protein